MSSADEAGWLGDERERLYAEIAAGSSVLVHHMRSANVTAALLDNVTGRLSAAGKKVRMVSGRADLSGVPFGCLAGDSAAAGATTSAFFALAKEFAALEVLVIDDAEHLDAATIGLVHQLLDSGRLVVAATPRLGSPIAELLVRYRATTIRLPGDVGESAQTGSPVDPELADALAVVALRPTLDWAIAVRCLPMEVWERAEQAGLIAIGRGSGGMQLRLTRQTDGDWALARLSDAGVADLERVLSAAGSLPFDLESEARGLVRAVWSLCTETRHDAARQLVAQASPSLSAVEAVVDLAQGQAKRAIAKLETARPEVVSALSLHAELVHAWSLAANRKFEAARAIATECGAAAARRDDDAEAAWALVHALAFGAAVAEELAATAERASGPLFDAVAIYARQLDAPDGPDAAGLLAIGHELAALGTFNWAAYAAADAATWATADEDRVMTLAGRCWHDRWFDECDAPVLPFQVALLLLDIPTLSEREAEVVALAAQQVPARAIAEQLYLSVRTVEGHLRRIYDQFGINSRAELAPLAGVFDGLAESPM